MIEALSYLHPTKFKGKGKKSSRRSPEERHEIGEVEGGCKHKAPFDTASPPASRTARHDFL